MKLNLTALFGLIEFPNPNIVNFKFSNCYQSLTNISSIIYSSFASINGKASFLSFSNCYVDSKYSSFPTLGNLID